MSKFNVGDKVWSAINGWGVVEKVLKGNFSLPVQVLFGGIRESFTSDGKYYSNSPAPILFHDEVKDWPNPPKPIDWSKVAVDTPVFVRFLRSDKWVPRHFAKYENGMYYCYIEGKTSFTTDKTNFWYECVLEETYEHNHVNS